MQNRGDKIVSSLKKVFKDYPYPIVICVIAAVLRLLFLDIRPAHHDEGINGWFVFHIVEHGFYRYDPANYHGPLHFYILFLFQTLFGQSNSVLRLPSSLVSILTVYWLTLFAPFFGKRASYLAALAMALSPAYIYFARFAIHEADLVFFLILTFWGMVGLFYRGEKRYLWAFGLGVTGAILTKETYAIHLGSFLLAYIALTVWEKLFPSKHISPAQRLWSARDLNAVLAISFSLILFFYSGNFMNFAGLVDIFTTFKSWVSTGSHGQGHEKPFYYWLKLAVKYEQFTVVGMIASMIFLFSTDKLLKFTAIYALCVMTAYTLIPYKTPWCIISIFWPFLFLSGTAIDKLLALLRYKYYALALCAILVILSSVISLRLNFISHSNSKEPYVYVQTTRDINRLLEPVFFITGEDLSNYSLTGHIMRSDPWPLPWTLHDFPNMGYYDRDRRPPKYDADLLFVEEGRIKEVEVNLREHYYTDRIQLRDSQDVSKLYLNVSKFETLFAGKEPDFTPAKQEPLIIGKGLMAYYYPNKNMTGQYRYKQVVRKIDFYWENGGRPLPSPFAIMFIGEIVIPSDDITLILATDDGGYVELDGRRVINDPGPHALHSKRARVRSLKGKRKIEVGYYDVGGGAIVQLKWLDSSGNATTVPYEAFRYDPEQE